LAPNNSPPAGCIGIRRAEPSGALLRMTAAGTGEVRTHSLSPLSQQQTAPYIALCGGTVTIVSEDSPYCGQSGRVRRVFWRRGTAWVVVRLRLGGLTAVPWDSTDLPVPQLEHDARPDGPFAALLSPIALRDLARFLRHRKHNAAR
jgi:hypothetical protein